MGGAWLQSAIAASRLSRKEDSAKALNWFVQELETHPLSTAVLEDAVLASYEATDYERALLLNSSVLANYRARFARDCVVDGVSEDERMRNWALCKRGDVGQRLLCAEDDNPAHLEN
jgi:hypothetical protein